MTFPQQTNPFVGLRPFESAESLFFFGRQEQTMELLQRLHEHHFVAIIGNSGCGKSSLIRGGLIPRLKAGYLVHDSDRWMIAMMKPGQSPLHNLAAVILNQLNEEEKENAVIGLVEKIREEGADAILHLLKPVWERQNTNLFLLVDQFEELFRFSLDQKDAAKKDEAIDFVNIMLQLARQPDLPVYVVMTMRSDFIGDCAQFFGLPEAMNESQYLVPRLNRIQLKSVIEGPVKLSGGVIHPSLTSRLLNDSGIVKDELPLLQHALMRIWDHQMSVGHNGELNLSDYESIGGIEKALSFHADEALKGMSENDLALTRKIFQALIMTDESGRTIRRPVLISELSQMTGKSKEELMPVISRFSEEKRSFLIVSKTVQSDDELIDISHESLIRRWEVLTKWAGEETDSSKIYLHLNESATLFADKKKDLLKGREFQIAMQWYESFKPSATWAKRYNDRFDESIDYLLKSSREVKLADRKKRNRMLLTFATIIISITGVFIFIKARTDAQKRAAITLKDAFRLKASSQYEEDRDPTVALRLGESGYGIEPDSTFRMVMQKMYTQNAFYRTLVIDSFGIPNLAVSPDGRSFLTASYGKRAMLWNMEGRLMATFNGHTDTVSSVAFSPDGTKILTSSRDGTSKLWDTGGKLIGDIKVGGGKLYTAIFSPDGTKILTGSMDGDARLWDTGGQLLKVFHGHTENIRSAAFSPDGTKFVTGSDDHHAILWSIDGKQLQLFRKHWSFVASVAFSPDGSKILTGSFDETAILWDLRGNVLQEFVGHYWPIYSVAFSQDGNKVLTASFDETARLWDLGGNVLQVLKGHSDLVRSAAFLPDGSRIVTTGSDRTVRLWYRVNNLFRDFRGYADSVNTVVFSPDGKKVLIGSSDKQIKLCNLNGTVIRQFQPHAGRINVAAFSPDEGGIFMSSDNILELRDYDDKLVRRFLGHRGKILSMALSQNGDRIATGSVDSTIMIWNLNGDLLTKIKASEKVVGVAFSADGKSIVALSFDFIVGQWTIDGKLIKQVQLKEKKRENDSVCVAFSPDATKLVVSNRDTVARLWSIEGILQSSFKGHRKTILAVTFSPDGSRVLTGAEDYSARLWNLDGRLLMELAGHAECVVDVAFSPDGTKILTGSEDHTARLWNNIVLEDFLKTQLLDNLTKEQERQYGIIK